MPALPDYAQYVSVLRVLSDPIAKVPMRLALIAAALTAIAAPAHAMLCEEGLTTPSAPVLTPVINAVLAGDYRDLTKAVDPSGLIPEADRQRIMADLEGRMPLGYDECAVLVTRSLGPELDTHLLMFETKGQRLYAFLAVARIAGEWQIIHQLFTPDFTDAYSLLR